MFLKRKMKDKQLTLTDIEHAGRKKTTRREEFLTSMDAIIPWEAWIEMIRPHYPSGKRGVLRHNICNRFCVFCS